MDPLDLTEAPPRSPRAPAGHLTTIFLARSIDKFRASLPGGEMGAYQIDGMTTRMLANLGLDRAAFAAAVANAPTEADVVAWVERETTPERRAENDAKLHVRRVEHRINDPDFHERYPDAASLPLDLPLIDMLDKDDAISYPGPQPDPGRSAATR